MTNNNEFEFEFELSEDGKSYILINIECGKNNVAEMENYDEHSVTEVAIPSEHNGLPVQIDPERVYEWSQGISSLLVEGDNQFYKSIDGVVYTKDGKTLVAYPRGKAELLFRIPQGVTKIEKSACCCVSTGLVEIPDTVIEIGNYAFGCCGTLEEKNLRVGRGIKTLGENSIMGFKRVYVPETFEGAEIEHSYRFDENGNKYNYDVEAEIFGSDWYDDGPCYFVGVVGGKSGSAIESYCSERNIPFVMLEDDEIDGFFATPLKELEERAVKQYENETEFVVRDERAGWSARFENGTLTFSSLNGHSCIEKSGRLICEPRRARVKKIIIGDGIGKLACGAFDERYENLESVHIGKDVCEIDARAFKVTFCYPCFNNLSEISVDEDNKWFKSVDGVLYTHNMKTLLKYPQGKKGFYFEINTNVGDYAFEYAKNLVCVKFGKGCKSIGETAFYNVRQYLHAWFDRSVKKWKEYPFQVITRHGDAYRRNDLVIGGYRDSFVHQFCRDNGVYFLPIEDEEETQKFMDWPMPLEAPSNTEEDWGEIFVPQEPKNPYYMECKKQMIIDRNGVVFQIGKIGDEIILPEGITDMFCDIDLSGVKRFVIPTTTPAYVANYLGGPAPYLQEIVVAEGNEHLKNEHLKTVDGHLCTTKGKFLTYLPTAGKVGIIPEGIVKISPYAFNLIEKPLEKLYLPASLTEWELKGCYRQNHKCFYDLEVAPNNTAFKAIDGNLFTADGKTLLYAKVNEGSFTVPDGTEVMERYSMAAVAEGSVVTIPASVREIKNVCFWNCTIKTTAGSYAEAYAKEHNVEVELM